MTHATNTRMNRFFEKGTLGNVVKRLAPLDEQPRMKVGNCYVCKLPIYIAPGQIQKKSVHGQCLKK